MERSKSIFFTIKLHLGETISVYMSLDIILQQTNKIILNIAW